MDLPDVQMRTYILHPLHPTCQMCKCRACDFCVSGVACKPFDRDDAEIEKCEPFCNKMFADAHCQQCKCKGECTKWEVGGGRQVESKVPPANMPLPTCSRVRRLFLLHGLDLLPSGTTSPTTPSLHAITRAAQPDLPRTHGPQLNCTALLRAGARPSARAGHQGGIGHAGLDGISKLLVH